MRTLTNNDSNNWTCKTKHHRMFHKKKKKKKKEKKEFCRPCAFSCKNVISFFSHCSLYLCLLLLKNSDLSGCKIFLLFAPSVVGLRAGTLGYGNKRMKNKSSDMIDCEKITDNNNNNNSSTPPQIITSLEDLKGDPTMQYVHGQVVWAKFLDFSWWPGTVLTKMLCVTTCLTIFISFSASEIRILFLRQLSFKKNEKIQIGLTQKDKDGEKIIVHWFVITIDYRVIVYNFFFLKKRDECLRANVLPFTLQLKQLILREIRTPDRPSFEASFNEASRVWREIREETGNTVGGSGNLIAIKTDEEQPITNIDHNNQGYNPVFYLFFSLSLFNVTLTKNVRIFSKYIISVTCN
ncbi:hypothetical protein RFI_12386 [Reticulomyxa filosa]|uniref:PWWP domain-containing protein n=1 Tax=Reticulomyxa filosa TaxID=46433 RepID=X6NHE0_RETFI|nr:hypothetical protein RFI_12386 [Reticulomyxa filosa]|eukprot:ETO24772.1 hypothetical protein RFI_12386 [Reticulomyxa filosa]